MKNRTASSKKQPVRKNDTAAKTGITAAWVVKNLLAVVVVAFLLNKLVLGLQPGYNWAYNMLKGNLEVAQHYAQTTTDERYEMKLGLSHVYMGVAVKIKIFEQWLAECGLQAGEVMYMGDDIPDYEVMRMAGLPACPADAAPEIKQIARYVSPFCGGMGCGRDIIEQVLRAQGKWMADEKAFGW